MGGRWTINKREEEVAVTRGKEKRKEMITQLGREGSHTAVIFCILLPVAGSVHHFAWTTELHWYLVVVWDLESSPSHVIELTTIKRKSKVIDNIERLENFWRLRIDLQILTNIVMHLLIKPIKTLINKIERKITSAATRFPPSDRCVPARDGRKTNQYLHEGGRLR